MSRFSTIFGKFGVTIEVTDGYRIYDAKHHVGDSRALNRHWYETMEKSLVVVVEAFLPLVELQRRQQAAERARLAEEAELRRLAKEAREWRAEMRRQRRAVRAHERQQRRSERDAYYLDRGIKPGPLAWYRLRRCLRELARVERDKARRHLRAERDAYYLDRGVEPSPLAWFHLLPDLIQAVLLGLAIGLPIALVIGASLLLASR